MARGPASILAADIGTSSLKAVLYTREGEVLAAATQRYEFQAAQPGWAEGEPEEWWRAFQAALADLQAGGQSLAGVEAVAFTGQMHTGVLLDAARQPLSPTILWLDRRAAEETKSLVSRLQLPPFQLNSTYTLPKLLWLKHNRPEVLAKTRTLLWPKDYLRYRLTGMLGTDLTEAGGAALLDWETGTWARERLDLVGLKPSVLPPTQAARAVVGRPLPEVADRLGLNHEAQVLVGLGDVAALIGGAPPRPGRVVCSLGSSSMVFLALAPDQHPADPAQRLYIYPFLPPYRLLGGVSSTTGAALVWAVNNLAGGQVGAFESVAAEAARLAPGGDGLCFLPYLAGERSPYWQDDLQAGFYGLRLSHTSRHLVRAVMEGIAFSLRHLLDIYAEMGVPVNELVLAGGGTKTPGLSQIIADVCQHDVAIYTEAETVTRVLYALCRATLDQSDFSAALDSTFPTPEIIRYNSENSLLYQPVYQRYRRFAAFASEEAARTRQAGA